MEWSTSATDVTSRPIKEDPDFEIREILLVESEIRNAFELRNTVQGTRNSSSPDKEPGSTTWNPESTTSESKTVLISFNGGVTSSMTNIPGVYSKRMDQRPLQC